MSSFTEQIEYVELPNKSINGRKLYKITKGFWYAVGDLENPILLIQIPKDFITDFASVPRFLHWLFKPTGSWSKAAAVHDYLYSNYPDISKYIKDGIFLEAMIVTGVPPFTAHLMFIATRICQALIDLGGWKINY